MNRLAIVKLGGSVITHKSLTPPRANREVITRIANELSTYAGRLVVVLGGGAHGHQAAYHYGFAKNETPPETLIRGIPHIRHNMTLLSTEVEAALREVGLPAVVIPPFPIATLNDGALSIFSSEVLEYALQSNLLVITHGDVCFDKSRGASIISGDTLVVHLTQLLSPDLVLIGTDVDGIFDSDPHGNPSASLIPLINKANLNDIRGAVGPSKSTDVTGGMSKKLDELLQIAHVGTKMVIFNLTIAGRLRSLLASKPTIGTEIRL